MERAGIRSNGVLTTAPSKFGVRGAPIRPTQIYRASDRLARGCSTTEVVFVTFESELSNAELEETLRSRAQKFREVEGLVQKYYLRDRERGKVGGFYVFDSEDSRDAYLESELRSTIADAYAANGEPDVSIFQLLFPLREAEGFPAPA